MSNVKPPPGPKPNSAFHEHFKDRITIVQREGLSSGSGPAPSSTGSVLIPASSSSRPTSFTSSYQPQPQSRFPSQHSSYYNPIDGSSAHVSHSAFYAGSFPQPVMNAEPTASSSVPFYQVQQPSPASIFAHQQPHQASYVQTVSHGSFNNSGWPGSTSPKAPSAASNPLRSAPPRGRPTARELAEFESQAPPSILDQSSTTSGHHHLGSFGHGSSTSASQVSPAGGLSMVPSSPKTSFQNVSSTGPFAYGFGSTLSHPAGGAVRKPVSVPQAVPGQYEPSWGARNGGTVSQGGISSQFQHSQQLPPPPGHQSYGYNRLAPASAAASLPSSQNSSLSPVHQQSRPSKIDFFEEAPPVHMRQTQSQSRSIPQHEEGDQIVSSYATQYATQRATPSSSNGKPQTEQSSRRHSSVPPRGRSADAGSARSVSTRRQQSETESPKERDVENLSEEERLAFSRKPPRNVMYKPYTAESFRNINVPIKLGSLGPDLQNEELQKKQEQVQRMREYARGVHAYNVASAPSPAEAKRRAPEPPQHEKNARERALEFARNVPKPKAKRREYEEPSAYSRNGNNLDFMSDLEKLEAQHEADVDAVEAIRREFMRGGF
eukprot:ANDGO_03055.mRNA.1 hypothetical protein (macronuclear)